MQPPLQNQYLIFAFCTESKNETKNKWLKPNLLDIRVFQYNIVFITSIILNKIKIQQLWHGASINICVEIWNKIIIYNN